MGEPVILTTEAAWELLFIIDRAMDLIDVNGIPALATMAAMRTWSIELLDRIYEGGGPIEPLT